MNNIRRSGRFSFRSNKRYNHSKTKTSNAFPHNKFRTKGNIAALYDKCIKLAKEFSSAGDRIQAEYYLQFADHYSRVMTEQGIKSFDNENINKSLNKESLTDSNLENGEENIKSTDVDNLESSEKTNIEDENDDSLETVSFISQPASKTVKSKK